LLVAVLRLSLQRTVRCCSIYSVQKHMSQHGTKTNTDPEPEPGVKCADHLESGVKCTDDQSDCRLHALTGAGTRQDRNLQAKSHPSRRAPDLHRTNTEQNHRQFRFLDVCLILTDCLCKTFRVCLHYPWARRESAKEVRVSSRARWLDAVHRRMPCAVIVHDPPREAIPVARRIADMRTKSGMPARLALDFLR
jgi:hypothetical protein